MGQIVPVKRCKWRRSVQKVCFKEVGTLVVGALPYLGTYLGRVFYFIYSLRAHIHTELSSSHESTYIAAPVNTCTGTIHRMTSFQALAVLAVHKKEVERIMRHECRRLYEGIWDTVHLNLGCGVISE